MTQRDRWREQHEQIYRKKMYQPIYKRIIFTKIFNDSDLLYTKEFRNYHLNPRNLLMDFIHEDGVEWFINRGIPLSVEIHKNHNDFSYKADLFAAFTAEQEQDWREQKIIKKLENSYSNF